MIALALVCWLSGECRLHTLVILEEGLEPIQELVASSRWSVLPFDALL